MSTDIPSASKASAQRTQAESSGIQSPGGGRTQSTEDPGASEHTSPRLPPAAIDRPQYSNPKYMDPEWQYEGRPKTKFNEDYPPDAWGEEASPNARVWKIYRDKQSNADKAMLDTWNKTLDVLLIFAGLFSAVSTAFIIESYKALQPDYTQYIANVLYAAAVGNQTLAGVTGIASPDSFHPSATERWTNGMWFSSLVVSLAVALLSILIKQWLDEYERHITGSAVSPVHWARRHQLYSRGLKAWGVPALISLLPLLLHVSLFLFFAGLVLFLRPLDDAIANTLLGLVAAVLLFYVLALLFPAWRVECPSYTPLLAQGRSAVTFVLQMLIYLNLNGLVDSCLSYPLRHDAGRFVRFIGCNDAMDALRNASRRTVWGLANLLERSKNGLIRETSAIDAQKRELDGWALAAVLLSTADSETVNAGIEALGAVPVGRTLDIALSNLPRNHWYTIYNALSPAVDLPSESGFAITTFARRMRTCLVGSPYRWLLPGPPKGPDLAASLGLDGMLLMAMAPDSRFQEYFDLGHLVTLLQRQLSAQISDSSQAEKDRFVSFGESAAQLNSLPHFTVCLLFLTWLGVSGLAPTEPRWVSCALLVLCAGQFHRRENDERTLAMRSLLTWLGAPVAHGDDADLVALNGLYSLLRSQDGLDGETIRIVMHHLLLLCQYIVQCPPDRRVKWSKLPDLSAFVRSPEFEQHLSQAAQASYMAVLARVDLSDIEETDISEDYCSCAAKLLRLSCDSDAGLPHVHEAELVFILEDLLLWRTSASLPESICDAVLRAFLSGENAVSTWSEERWVGWDNANPFTRLANILSSILCHKQRRRRPLDLEGTLVDGFFSGGFLLHRFRTFLSRNLASDWIWSDEIMPLARHCARISPPSWERVCAALETTGDEGSALRADALRFADALRTRLMPGNVNTDCTQQCYCMRISAAVANSTKTLGRWRWRDRILGIAMRRTRNPARFDSYPTGHRPSTVRLADRSGLSGLVEIDVK